MFDLTRLARACGLSLAVYIIGYPVLVILGGILISGFRLRQFDHVLDWWVWPVPCLFPLLSAVLTVDFYRRLRTRRLTSDHVDGYRFVAALLTAGAAFAITHTWVLAALSGACLLLTLMPVKKRIAARP